MTALREALKRLEQMGVVEVRHGDATRVRDWRRHGGLDVIAHVLLRSGGVDVGVLRDVFEARSLMLRELAGLAAARRTAAQAGRLTDLAAAIAEAPDSRAAQEIDFVFFEEVADAAGNVVFVVILNSIRAMYFAHADRLPVTARPAELAPFYAEAAGAIEQRDDAGARSAVWELAERQRTLVTGERP
jgi:GntR family transcriptional regulator, transcriptional repressor for pyruvate dehydrogenase complex